MRLSVLSILAVVCLAPALRAANADRHVVLISLDGFPAYSFRDPSIPLPNLRRLAAEGAVADAMTISNPAITWPNHTTMVTGVSPRKHGVLYNSLVTRQGPDKPTKVDQWVDQTQLVRVPTVYDVAYKAGLTTAEMDWVAITRSKTITWAFPERIDADSALPKEMLAAGAITRAELDLALTNRANIVSRDEMWTRAACFVLERHRPNLLLFHLLTTDSVPARWPARRR
jgi:hypothetical protein